MFITALKYSLWGAKTVDRGRGSTKYRILSWMEEKRRKKKFYLSLISFVFLNGNLKQSENGIGSFKWDLDKGIKIALSCENFVNYYGIFVGFMIMKI